MRPKLALALSALIVAAVPAILIGNTLWVLVNPWFVHAQYSVPGFPADSHGLNDQERTDLAVTGIRAVRPGSDGVEKLREARLPSSDLAFEEREIQHMADVRGLVAGFLTVWAVALVLTVAAALGLRQLGAPGSVGSALVAGAFLTVAAMALVGLIMLINFEVFFDGFHGVFFEGDSWRFNSSYILRQLYPDFFWGVASGTMAALVVLQAVALVAGFRPRGRDDRRLAHATPMGARDVGSPIH
jgi:integral membrane protein (TIGR01906 family)